MLRALWLAEEDQEALRDAAAILADQADNMVTASRKRLGELPFMRGRSDRDVTPSIRGDFGYVYELSPQSRRRVTSRFSSGLFQPYPGLKALHLGH